MKPLRVPALLLVLLTSGLAQGNPPAPDNPPTASQNLTLALVKAVEPEYPISAEAKQLRGDVLVRVESSELGEVDSVQVVSGDPTLAAAVVSAVKQWVLQPFLRNGKPAKVSFLLPFKLVPPVKGPPYAPQLMRMQVEPSTSSRPKPSKEVTTDKVPTEAPIRVSPGIMGRFMVQSGFAPWPRELRELKGAVVLKVLIGKDGSVRHVEAVSGPEKLIDNAIETVRQRKYMPFVLDDRPVEVETEVRIIYNMPS